jgi:hypothetical protein
MSCFRFPLCGGELRWPAKAYVAEQFELPIKKHDLKFAANCLYHSDLAIWAADILLFLG